MRKPSLAKRIETYLKKQNKWVSGGELEQLAMQAHYKGSTASRVARTLAENDVLERRETEKGYVEYKYKLHEKIVTKYERVGDVFIPREEKVMQ